MPLGPAAEFIVILGVIFLIGIAVERWKWGPAVGALCVIALILDSLLHVSG